MPPSSIICLNKTLIPHTHTHTCTRISKFWIRQRLYRQRGEGESGGGRGSIGVEKCARITRGAAPAPAATAFAYRSHSRAAEGPSRWECWGTACRAAGVCTFFYRPHKSPMMLGTLPHCGPQSGQPQCNYRTGFPWPQSRAAAEMARSRSLP